ncbi:Transcription factor bHLH30 like [Actinidia chinensis var. chinensis]|uniref:Transcription factor bHLH30 like n=1 Tax=Actinidia chinensis var. chinensis TaxID=1590841 RepID=A0A2R6QAC4_ACTCC|nr:Transcription factor bHLH30 like [Actinidia chinensis var. chinensis]
MGSYFWDSNTSNASKFSGIFGPNSGNLGGFCGNLRGGSVSVSQSLVLDSERSEIVKAPAGVGKKNEVSEEKIMAALKNHSEAERRRRERINAHLSTLRGLVPCTEKMDKAALLAEVISQVKQLKKTATETSEGLLIPMDTDEVRVESHKEGDGSFSFRASLCCDYRPELLSELRQALEALHLNMVKAEISTLGSRVKNVFVFTSVKETNSDNSEECQILVNSVHQAFSTILDKISAAAEYLPRTTLPNKRRRISFFDSSSSSS